MKLLLFGGTFDPPHVGHMSILRNAVAAVHPDKVVVMPAATPPHKAASATPAELRMEMCRCFWPLFADLEVSDLEMRREGKSYTWDTVRQLRGQNPGAEIFLCIGSDMLLSFTTWYRYEDLLRVVTLVVQNRQVEDVILTGPAVKDLETKGGRVMFASGEVEEVSSTEIREHIAEGFGDGGLIPPPADEIVKREGLYRSFFTVQQAKDLAKQTLSEKRYIHTKNVVAAAKHLAKRWGAEEEKAELAGWLHDIAKERSEAEMLRILGQDGIIAQRTVRRPKPVWHGPCAAVFAKRDLLVRDEDVLSAVACHTTGKAGMNLLDKVLFVADMTSAERDFDGADELRRMADENLEKAVVEIMRRGMAYVRQCGKPLDEESILALQDMERKTQYLFKEIQP